MSQEALAPENELRTGQLLAGKYRLEGELGRGAMGTVWSALHESLGQRVAIKVISPEHASSDELRRRFDTEARAAAKLRSRFVVGVYDHGTTKSGLPYIVMEYLEGECLEDRLNRQGVLSIGEVARITRHVGRALSRAHANGIVHRDLKPANIFLTKSDEEEGEGDWIAKVLDFGIAKVEDFSDRSTTKTGTVLGTPLFMSPEQVRGASSVDSRADLYSLGMVIYNMLTGAYAFEGQSFGDLLVSICTDPLPNLTDRAPQLPESLNPWFQKACAREPAQRYQSAEELVAAFLEAVGEVHSVRMSLIDPTAMSQRAAAHLAATFTADSNSEVSSPGGTLPIGTRGSQSGSSHTGQVSRAALRATQRSDAGVTGSRSGLASAGPSTLTLSGDLPLPRSRPLWPWAIGAAAVAAVLVGFVVVGRGSGEVDGGPTTAQRPTEIELDRPARPPALPTDTNTPGSTQASTTTNPIDSNLDPSRPDSKPTDPTGKKPLGARPLSPTTTAPTTAVTAPTTTTSPPTSVDPKPPTTGVPDVGF